MKVFLGGTVNNSKWRDYVISKLSVDYFNPVVDEWTTEAQEQEIFEREHCDYCLYVITPRMTGYYAIAEIIDDSFKRPDRTIFCYLKVDDEYKFNEQQIKELEDIRKIVEKNGGLYINNIDEVVRFLNSANSLDKSLLNEDIKDVFISYGRRHSLDFAKKLHDKLTADGSKVWFDMNNIPLGVDFQEQIDQGIQKADNFIYIISPHSVKSEYCLKEVILALKYNKRIIPILHIEPVDCWDKIHVEIGRRNWIYMREQADENIPRTEWKQIDDFTNNFAGLKNLLNLHKDYVRKHTILLNFAINWHFNQRKTNLLIVGNERIEAEQWLLKNTFKNEKGENTQQPCYPTTLHAEYICEAKKNSNNLQTDTFLSYSVDNKTAKEKIYKSLIRRGITVWTHTNDIEKGEDFESAIKRGIEQADNFIYFISKESIESEYCYMELVYSIKLNKRIIPILIDKLDISVIPSEIKKMQYIDFSDCIYTPEIEIIPENEQLSREDKIKKDVESRREKTTYELKVDQLLFEIQDDAEYYHKHKILLVQAIRWEKQSQNQSVLLRGYNLENAKTWLKLAEQKPNKPLQIHKDFIVESEAKSEILDTEVFISYSRTDADFARKLNLELQLAGKTTWFDQESIASSDDFQQEIKKGIASSNNFVFVISSDSVNSTSCIDEVTYAKQINKRIITILLKETDTNTIPEILNSIQGIDFGKRGFNISFHELIRTLDTDREYIQKHTKFSQLSSEWINKNKDEDLLLRGSEFAIAEEWLQTSVNLNKKPEPTKTQIDYIEVSKKTIEKANQVKKNRQIYMRILLFLSIIGVFVSLYFMLRARTAMNQAHEQEQNIQNLYLASISKDIMENEPVKALQLVYSAFKVNTEETHPFIIKAFTDVFNNFKTGKKAYYIDEIYLSSGLYNVTYTIDGSKLFAFSQDSIKVWDSDGNIISQFAAAIIDAKISDDGSHIIVSNDNKTEIYDINGNIIKTITNAEGYFNNIITDTDKFLSFSWSNELIVYDFTGKEVSNFRAGDTLINYYTYIPNEDKFITINAIKQLTIWSLSGDTLLQIENYIQENPITNAANNILVSEAKNDSIIFYDFNGKMMSFFKKNYTIKMLRLLPNGNQLIIQKADDNLYLINNKGVQLSKFNMQETVKDIKISLDSKKALVITASDVFHLWDFETGKTYNFEGHKKEISNADFIPNTQYVISFSFDKTAKLWSYDGKLKLSLDGHSQEIYNYSISDNSKLLTFSYDGTGKIWDISKIEEPKFIGHQNLITKIVTSDSGNYIGTLSSDNTAKIWSKDGKVLFDYSSTYGFLNIIFSKSSDYYAIIDTEKAYIYNINGSLIKEFILYERYFTNIIFSDDSKYFLTYSEYDTYMLIYNSIDGSLEGELNIETLPVIKTVFHDANNLFILTGDDKVSKYNSKGVLASKSFTNDKKIFDIVWKDNNLKVLRKSIKSNTLLLTDFEISKPVTIKGIKDEINNAKFTTDGSYFYTDNSNNMLYFYDFDGNLISTFYESIQNIIDIKFSLTGNLALISYWDFKFKLIDIKGGYIISEKENISSAAFSCNGMIYTAIENQIEEIYTIPAAIEWIEKNSLPPLTERDKEKYGINTKNVKEK